MKHSSFLYLAHHPVTGLQTNLGWWTQAAERENRQGCEETTLLCSHATQESPKQQSGDGDEEEGMDQEVLEDGIIDGSSCPGIRAQSSSSGCQLNDQVK